MIGNFLQVYHRRSVESSSPGSSAGSVPIDFSISGMQGSVVLSETTGGVRKGVNPFPGLRSFDIWENYLFFGRDQHVAALQEKLSRHRFVCVVGTSGSGKSSLVRAGLLPSLFAGYQTETGSRWRVALFRPGNEPIHNLAAALNQTDVFGPEDPDQRVLATATADATLESSSLGLIQIVRRAQMLPGENLLIVVDQFEELFRFKKNNRISGAADQADGFVNLLLEAVGQREIPIYVVLTLRSDFLGDTAQYRDLPEAINEGQFLIPRLRREGLRMAVNGPVAVGGGKIAPRLVQQLLNDVGDNPDQLPILQHSLMRTWDLWTRDHEDGEPLELRHYEQIGGMSKALSQHADEAYHELPDERSRHIAEALFKSLTERGPDNRGIRRPTRLATICQVAEATEEEVTAVVDVFRRPGRSFIMPPAGVAIGAETILDISHESLMRVWDRLVAWVDEDAESAHIYRRLVESAIMYEDGNGGLWRDPELQAAVDWREHQRPNEPWAAQYHPEFARAMAFLDASIRERDAEIADARRRTLVARAIVIAFLVSAGILTSWALSERGSATANMSLAQQQKSLAIRQSEQARNAERQAREQKEQAEHNSALAETQRLQAEKQRKLADEQRKEAERQKQIAQTQQREALSQKKRAEESGRQALVAKDAAEAERVRALEQTRLAEQREHEAQESAEKVRRLRLLSNANRLAVKTLQLQNGGQDSLMALLAMQAYAFNTQNGGNPRDPDIYDVLSTALRPFRREERSVLRAHTGMVRSVASSPDGRRIASAGSDGRILLWETQSPERGAIPVARHPFIVRTLAFSPDNTLLAYAGNSSSIKLNRFGSTNHGESELRGTGGDVSAIAFMASGRKLVSLGVDGTINVWDLLTLSSDTTLRFVSRIRSLAVSESGSTIVGGAEDGSVIIWDLDLRETAPRTFRTGRSQVTALALSRDGRTIATGVASGVVRLWDLNTLVPRFDPFNGHRAPVNSLSFTRDGNLLASASNDATIRVWNLERPEDLPIILHEHSLWVLSVAFTPDGQSIISGGHDRTVRIYPARADEVADALAPYLKRNLSRREWAQYIGSDIEYQQLNPKLGE
jgi:WD40 repeat protein